jgi:hypothetical protein
MSFFKTFTYGQHLTAIFLFLIFFIIELLLRNLKAKKRKEFETKKVNIESVEEIEDLSIEHYKQLQYIDVLRFVIIIIGIIAILGAYNVQAFNILAVATGAFILALRESFTSLVAYFYILSNFKLGDDIRVNTFLGEIVRVKPLYTAIAGKDENGEYNSKLHHIPNFMFLSQIVEQQQLKSDDYRKVSLSVLYDGELFSDNFDSWIGKIEKFLEELLPKRALTKVGYFKGYAGIRYKMNFDYNDASKVVLKISFIVRSNKALEQKESIIRFVESLKKPKVEEK